MGLNARVKCNCFREGKTTNPPFDRGLLTLEPNGELSLTVSWDENEELQYSFNAWSHKACAHPLQDYTEIWLGTWGGVRSFKHALAAVGRAHVGTLLNAIPDLNGGEVPPAAAAQALQEVAYLREQPGFGKSIALVDLDSGLNVAGLEPAVESGWHICTGGILTFKGTEVTISLGRPEKGFAPVFTATSFTQSILQWAEGHPALVELCNLEIGQRFRWEGCFTAWRRTSFKDAEAVYPTRLHVVYHNCYTCTLDELARIFRASIETGNPVIWF